MELFGPPTSETIATPTTIPHETVMCGKDAMPLAVEANGKGNSRLLIGATKEFRHITFSLSEAAEELR